MLVPVHRWQKLAGRLLDFVYTPQCALCEQVLQHGRSLCDSCDKDLPRLTPPFCEQCGEPFQGRIDEPFQCPNCGELDFAFAFARPAMLRDERTRQLIHQLKYSRAIHLAAELGRLATEAFGDERLRPALSANWPLVPVPLHRSRLQHRNFNQAAEIARVVSKLTSLPVLAALKRIRRTDTQTMLGRRARLHNLHAAFTLTSAGHRHLSSTGGPGAVLIDDVLTTGSTAQACATTLRRAGFKTVLVVTVMRG